MSKIVLTEEAGVPSTPAAGKWTLYTKAGGLYYLDDAGTEIGPLSTGGTGGGDWVAGTGTWSYSATDAPTFVISVNNDQTGIISVGMKIKLTQTTVKYFIVTAVGAYSGGATLITVYGGTDYTLANAAITTPFISGYKAPFGFPLSPIKWTTSVTDTTNRSQASPTADTWYNLGSVSLSVPIGLWRISYSVLLQANITGTAVNALSTLSTANNTASDADFTVKAQNNLGSSNLIISYIAKTSKVLSLSSKTPYYLNSSCESISATTLYNVNGTATALVSAECAYL